MNDTHVQQTQNTPIEYCAHASDRVKLNGARTSNLLLSIEVANGQFLWSFVSFVRSFRLSSYCNCKTLSIRMFHVHTRVLRCLRFVWQFYPKTMIVCVHEMSKQIKNRVIRHFVIGKLNGQTYTHCSSHKTSWPSQSFTTSRYAHSHTETIHNMNMQKNKGKTREKKTELFTGNFISDTEIVY